MKEKKLIKYLVMDVDGTLTDGKLYIGNKGELFKAFDIKDGYGIKNILKAAKITPIIITGRKSKIVENRCNELNIKKIYQGIKNKSEKLANICKDISSVAYIGDDDNDLECMKLVLKNKGIVGCPFDASKNVKNISSFVSRHKGGKGAVRDFCEYLLKYNNEK